jgi:hypothetical protein
MPEVKVSQESYHALREFAVAHNLTTEVAADKHIKTAAVRYSALAKYAKTHPYKPVVKKPKAKKPKAKATPKE